MRLFDTYLCKQLFVTLMMVLLLLLGLDLFFGLIQELKWVGRGTYSLQLAFVYLGMTAPTKLYQMLPWASCLGTLIGLGALAEHSELVAIRAAGVSIIRIAVGVIKAMALFVFVAVLIGEGVAPYLEDWASARRTLAISGGQMLETPHGVWTRHGHDFIHIQSVQPDGSLHGVTRYLFDANRHLTAVSFAETAVATEDKSWVLQNIQETHFEAHKTVVSHKAEERLKQLLEPELIKTTGMKHPEYLSLPALWKNIKHRTKHGLDATSYWLAWWSKVFHPLAILVMSFLAIPFVFGPLRRANVGQKLVTGFLLGFVFFTLNRTFAPLAVVYHITPWLAAILPVLLFSLLGLYLIRRVRSR